MLNPSGGYLLAVRYKHQDRARKIIRPVTAKISKADHALSIFPLLPNLFLMHQMNADMSNPQYQNSEPKNDILPIDS